MLRLLGIFKIPLLAYVRPVVEEVNDKKCVIKIPLSYRSKNHLGSMYFGALAIGADCAGGLIAAKMIRDRKLKVSLVFKSFEAKFIKRPEADVYFIFDQGDRVQEQVERALKTGERQNEVLPISACIKKGDAYETVAEFKIELSLKSK